MNELTRQELMLLLIAIDHRISAIRNCDDLGNGEKEAMGSAYQALRNKITGYFESAPKEGDTQYV